MTAMIPIKLLDTLCLPSRKTKGAVGFDLVAREDVSINPQQIEKVPVGFCLELPEGMEAQIRPRSGMNVEGHLTLFGTIDSDYRGEVAVVIFNTRVQTKHIKRGDRVAQMVLSFPVVHVDLSPVETLGETARGAGGFGSTGKSEIATVDGKVIALDGGDDESLGKVIARYADEVEPFSDS